MQSLLSLQTLPNISRFSCGSNRSAALYSLHFEPTAWERTCCERVAKRTSHALPTHKKDRYTPHLTELMIRLVGISSAPLKNRHFTDGSNCCVGDQSSRNIAKKLLEGTRDCMTKIRLVAGTVQHFHQIDCFLVLVLFCDTKNSLSKGERKEALAHSFQRAC